MSNLKILASKLAKECEVITGINCTVIDMKNSSCNSTFYNRGFCSVCKKFRKNEKRDFDCVEMMNYSCMQSEQWGGKYECLCPMSLAFICTFLYDKTDKLGICLGPFLMVEVDDFISEDIGSHFNEEDREKIFDSVRDIPYIEISNVSAYSNMLFMAACHIAKKNSLDITILEQLADNSKEQFDYILNAKDDLFNGYPLQTEHVLSDNIKNGNLSAARSALNNLSSHLFLNAAGDVDVVRARVIELVTLMSRAAVDGGADAEKMLAFSKGYISSAFNLKTIRDYNSLLSDALLKFANSVLDTSNLSHSNVILNTVAYIRNNYMKRIIMDDIAKNVGLSVSYISRIFKKEMGYSLITFLNKVRIDNAKILLLENNIPLVEVAYLCGFEDQTYFNKVFKKLTGFTPGKFRESRGKLL